MNIASYLEHTILRADIAPGTIEQLCHEAVEWGCAGVCVPPTFVREARQHLPEKGVALVTVVGFPFGFHLTAVKAAEAELAIVAGADEIDLVANLSALKNGDWRILETEIREMLEVVKLSGKKLKVIIEAAMLTPAEMEAACAFYSKFRIDYLKTSTGFGPGGATVEQIELLRKHLPDFIRIKASGGIRSYADAKKMIDAGADRIGTSSARQIIEEAQSE
jgi:deoxyribose-phosphate aldolase